LFLDAIQEGNKSNSRRQRGEYITSTLHLSYSGHYIAEPVQLLPACFSAQAELKYNILGPIIAALDPILNIVTSIPSLCFEWASF